jgi:hypothetical protein
MGDAAVADLLAAKVRPVVARCVLAVAVGAAAEEELRPSATVAGDVSVGRSTQINGKAEGGAKRGARRQERCGRRAASM